MADGLFALESELRLLGAAMYSPSACDVALDQLRDEHFGDPIHGLIWETIRTLAKSGRAPTPEIVRDAIGLQAGFEAWGGFGQLWDLWDGASTVGVADHLQAIADRAGRRAIKALVDDIGAKVPDTGTGDYVSLLGELEHGAAEIARGAVTADAWIAGDDMVRDAIAFARGRTGKITYPFGVQEVDDHIGGMNAGEATWIAARTGMGKTVAGQTIAMANAAKGLGTCFFSLEMAAHPLGLRLASDLVFQRGAPIYSAIGGGGNVTADKAMKNMLSDDEWSRFEAASEIVKGWPLAIDTRPGLTMVQIEAAARRRHRWWERKGIAPGPVIIDHLGRVRPSVDRKGNRTAEVADVSKEASEMAKRLGVPVVGLVQLNRGVESREDKRPQLSDLRQAGELEEDARQVVFIYRPEYYLRAGADGETLDQEIERKAKLRDVERKMYWIVGKNSHGPLGEVLTYCDIASSAVRSWQP